MTMKRLLYPVLAIVLLLTLFAPLQSTEAKGSPTMILISGLGIEGEVEIRLDGELLNLGYGGLEDFAGRQTEAPNVVGPGFHITRGYVDNSDNFTPFDEIMYYPDPLGGRGYVYNLGMVNGSSEYDNEWFSLLSNGERELKRILLEHGAQIVLVIDEDQELPDGCLVAEAAYLTLMFADAFNRGDQEQLAGFLGIDKKIQNVATSSETLLDELLARYEEGERWDIQSLAVQHETDAGQVDLEFVLALNDEAGTMFWGHSSIHCETQTFLTWQLAKFTEKKVDLCPVETEVTLASVLACLGED